MINKIYKEIAEKEYFSAEGCYINELFNEAIKTGASIAKAIVEPGITTENHFLKETEEWYYLLEGRGEMYINGIMIGEVSKGEIIHIPSNIPQCIKNTGTENLVFLCFCVPAFNLDRYVKVE
jgi:mannose-6-phosphate isomerase-like protein (cupin superfamily)